MDPRVLSEYIRKSEALGVAPHPDFERACRDGLSRCVLSPRDGVDGDRALQAIADLIPSTGITELAIAAWPLSASSWIALCNAMGEHAILEGLAICGCQLSIEPAAFIQALGRVRSLRTLSLMQMPEVAAMIEPLVGSSLLRQGSRLTRLVVFEGGVRPIHARPLLDAMRSYMASVGPEGLPEIPLDQLDLSNNELGPEGGRLVAETLLAQPPYPLKGLMLSKNLLGDGAASDIIRAAAAAPGLRYLNLDENGLSEYACDAATSALASGMRFLEDLSLGKIHVASDAAFAALIRAAASHKALRALDVSGTPLGPLALAAVCALVSDNAILTKLKLQLADDGQSEQIANAVRNNGTLTELDVVGPVSDNAHMAITAILQNNRRGADVGALAASNIKAFVQSTEQALYMDMEHGAPEDDAISQASSRLTPSVGGRAARMSSARSNASSSSRNLTKNYTVLAAEAFKKHDKEQRGWLSARDVEQVLAELGVLDGFSQPEIEKIVRNEFRIADSNNTGKLGLDQFSEYYVAMLKRIKEEQRDDKFRISRGITYPPGYRRHAELREVFKSFASFGSGHGVNRKEASKYMDNFRFSKLCKDASFTEPKGPLPFAMVDVIFARAKPQDSQRMEFRDFLKGLAILSQEMRRSFEDIVEALGCEPLPLDTAWAAPSKGSSRRSSIASSEDKSSHRRAGLDSSSIVSGDEIRAGAGGAKFFQTFYQSEFGPKKGQTNLGANDLPNEEPTHSGHSSQRMQQYLDHAADLVKPAAPGGGGGGGTPPPASRGITNSHSANSPLSKLNSLGGVKSSLAEIVATGLSTAPRTEDTDGLVRTLQQVARVVEERLGALEERMASVEQEAYLARLKAQEAGAGAASRVAPKPDEAVAGLRSDVAALQQAMQSLQSESRERERPERQASTGAGLGASGHRTIKELQARADRIEEAAREAEKKFAQQHSSLIKSVRGLEQSQAGIGERHARVEAALVQIAGHVDSLEKTIREERETSTRILEMLAALQGGRG